MNIGIGEKIRQLRHRDGRKQEDLAGALGVSPQAVSRWEAGGCYPDMELIPAIANYFNISIDELFGYSRDRQQKLKSILEKADEFLNAQGDMTECLSMLRSAAAEFPSEPLILIRLGYALSMQGWKKHGARSYTEDGSDYVHEDSEYNASNIYWQEEIQVFERVLQMDIPPDDRDTITPMLIIVYAKMGLNDKAKALASRQNSIISSRELLLPSATKAEERDRYQGEAIVGLLAALKNMIYNSVLTKTPYSVRRTGIEVFIQLIRLYESVFSDGRCGAAHLDICELYLYAAIEESRFGSIDKAFEYFCSSFEQHKLYESACRTEGYQYTALLVAKLPFSGCAHLSVPEMPWKAWLSVMSDELAERIRMDERFGECFAE